MSALATSDSVAALRMGPGTPGGSTGATSEGVTPGWNRIPESSGCCAGDREVEAEGALVDWPVLWERAARTLEFREALAILGRSWTVECGDGVWVECACDDKSACVLGLVSVPEPLTLCAVELAS